MKDNFLKHVASDLCHDQAFLHEMTTFDKEFDTSFIDRPVQFFDLGSGRFAAIFTADVNGPFVFAFVRPGKGRGRAVSFKCRVLFDRGFVKAFSENFDGFSFDFRKFASRNSSFSHRTIALPRRRAALSA